MNYRRGKGHTFAHAGAEFREPFLACPAEIHRVEQFVYAAPGRLFVQTEHARLEKEKLVGVKRIEQTERFRHHAHAAFQRNGAIAERLTQNADLARIGIEKPGQATDGGALSRTIGARGIRTWSPPPPSARDFRPRRFLRISWSS